MGSPEAEPGRWDDEGPQHHVNLTQGYWLGATPVTQALWSAVLGNNPSEFKGLERPVEQVSWDEAQGFIQALNKEIPGLDVRLPSEAEWEYACRAGTETLYWSGDTEADLARVAWYSGNSESKTHPVAGLAANPWGLYDMHGNVWEWCQDYWSSYQANAAIDPQGPEFGAKRVVRGGSWDNHARNARAASRNWLPPGVRYDFLGFRLARGQVAER